MTKRVVVLGAGRVGALIARDLAEEPSLTVVAADRDRAALEGLDGGENLIGAEADLSREGEAARLAAAADAVVVAVPGFMGTRVLREVIDAGAPAVDISFSPEDSSDLDVLARARGVPVVVDCGVAPGLSHLLTGRSCAGMDPVESVSIMVGGLPAAPVAPWGYRAVFSPTDVIEEYTRPCRIRENGLERVVPALGGLEQVEFRGVGVLEAFWTDGLRSLLRTCPARNLTEKTLRYPGHADGIRLLKDSGFFDQHEVQASGASVRPRAFTEAILARAWRLEPGEADLTVLRVVVEGFESGIRVRDTWELLDRPTPSSRSTSMARTTGFACAIVARLLLDGTWREPGVHPPETLGRQEALTARVLKELASRDVRVHRHRDRVV